MPYEAKTYMHEMDRRAMDALNAFPLFLRLRKAYSAHYDEKEEKIKFLSDAIRLGPSQMPEVYNLLPPICEKLGIEMPELYYVMSGEMNAATMGTTTPIVYVTSSICSQLPQKQLSSILAHECGHIACRHSLYHSLAGFVVRTISAGTEAAVPWLNRFLTPTLVKAILFWDRCSELSADRAAVLCDGESEDMIDALLRIHGYGKNINRAEFLKQAIDLHDFIDSSKSNQMMEKMLTEEDTHPRLATRVYECDAWAKSDIFREIIEGTYTAERFEDEEKKDKAEDELISAEIDASNNTNNSRTKGTVETAAGTQHASNLEVDEALSQVNRKLERYTNQADRIVYSVAVFCGLMAGAVDALFVGETVVTKGDLALSNRQVNNFIQQYAKFRGFPEGRLKDSIADLEKEFVVVQDNIWKGKNIQVAARNHHLADLAHHPTPIGLLSAIVVRFLRVGTFVNREGKWHFLLVKTDFTDISEVLIPAVIAGVLNWIVSIGEKKYQESGGEELSPAVKRIAHLAATTPVLIEIAKCADNWFGHLVSDMGGSKNTAGEGMGIPGIFISFLHEVSALPVLKDTELPHVVNDLYQNHKIDLRHELAYVHAAKKQLIPVIFNDIYTRILYFACMLGRERATKDWKEVNWRNVIPFGNRTIDRMITVSSITFNIADTADAAVRAAIESGGNWVIFSARFVARYNYVGAGRAAFAIVKEISNEKCEAQLIHEKLILTAAKTQDMMEELQEYKTQLSERIEQYLVEDIETFLQGFDYMEEGARKEDSDMFIKGNVIIQRVLGREVQFSDQSEFDELMGSDVPLIL